MRAAWPDGDHLIYQHLTDPMFLSRTAARAPPADAPVLFIALSLALEVGLVAQAARPSRRVGGGRRDHAAGPVGHPPGKDSGIIQPMPSVFALNGQDTGHTSLGPLSVAPLTSSHSFTRPDADPDVLVVESGYAKSHSLKVGSAVSIHKIKYTVPWMPGTIVKLDTRERCRWVASGQLHARGPLRRQLESCGQRLPCWSWTASRAVQSGVRDGFPIHGRSLPIGGGTADHGPLPSQLRLLYRGGGLRCWRRSSLA